jgi:ATP-binding cassette subfamily F protein 3
MAQSIMKKLDKLDRIEDVSVERPNIRINFRVDKTPGKVLVELDNISKSFGEQVILDHAKAEIERGDKIALIGANGKGKSTLLRIIAGIEPIEGERKWGHNVDESFYAQHQLESLNLNNTILDEMRSCGAQMTDAELRTLLGCFLFSGDDADKKIKVLSGGEKARVALAKTIVSKANFLMLDEPTNHLDMHSCDLLIDALKKYEGSLVIVSHDRHFISKTANKIWEIVDHQIKEFKGGYDEWVAWNERMAAQAKQVASSKKEEQKANAAPAPAPVVKEKPVEIAPKNQAINKEQKKELQKQQRQFQQAEEALNKNKTLLKTLESKLADPAIYADKDKFVAAEQEYKKAAEENKQLEKKYEEIFTLLMELEEQAG